MAAAVVIAVIATRFAAHTAVQLFAASLSTPTAMLLETLIVAMALGAAVWGWLTLRDQRRHEAIVTFRADVVAAVAATQGAPRRHLTLVPAPQCADG